MTVRQVSKQCGLSVDTIRYYERVGLITVEKGSYYKNYDQQTAETLFAIKRLRLAGLSIEEIKWLLSIDVKPTDLSQKQINSISAIIDKTLDRAKIYAKEIAESQLLLENMKNKLITVRNEDN
ncbi:MAG: MerR family transcriptional regulator [Clostridiales bacterium]|nr:MerR family transcriptional regulator [Clostridiales bacterium]